MEDLTPIFPLQPSRIQVAVPVPFQAQAPQQQVGGFTSTPGGLNNGYVSFDSQNTQFHITVGGLNLTLSGADVMTYASTIALDTQKADLHTTTTTNAIGNATINASSGGTAGQKLFIIITNDATANRTITFGTNFKPSGTLVGTTSKSALVQFISDGTSFYEVSRTTGL